MNVVRLNTAHMNHDDALEVIRNTRAVSDTIGILLDTKGPEIRACAMEAPLAVKCGDTVLMKGAPDETSRDNLICVSHSDFVEDVPVGSSILIDDGLIALVVTGKEGNCLKSTVENDGTINARKSIISPRSM